MPAARAHAAHAHGERKANRRSHYVFGAWQTRIPLRGLRVASQLNRAHACCSSDSIRIRDTAHVARHHTEACSDARIAARGGSCAAPKLRGRKRRIEVSRHLSTAGLARCACSSTQRRSACQYRTSVRSMSSYGTSRTPTHFNGRATDSISQAPAFRRTNYQHSSWNMHRAGTLRRPAL